ncbi:MAG: threonylcarbamoyl-AMP synthase [Candidatus Liptonbacteria bacterium]|nr:threonylcarbamoyl-AMP synthase [Candidatus Liptonbacteria bacterium]
MTKVFFNFNSEVVKILKRGGAGVMPTDTIYGIVGSAMSRKTVARIYRLRKRRPDKPMIILINSFSVLKIFGIVPDAQTKKLLKRFWPGKVSVILRVKSHESKIKLKYLHRGTNSLAFRLPKPYWLRKLLAKTGPLVAPSANLEGKTPATTIKEAQKYFGAKADFYVDAGKLIGVPSAIVAFRSGKALFLRKGANGK